MTTPTGKRTIFIEKQPKSFWLIRQTTTLSISSLMIMQMMKRIASLMPETSSLKKLSLGER